jgi:hypothetical protein
MVRDDYDASVQKVNLTLSTAPKFGPLAIINPFFLKRSPESRALHADIATWVSDRGIAVAPEVAERDQVSPGMACCELAKSACGLSDLHATARWS